MNNTKIDWCDHTVNPVVGCPRGCPYCYAKRMNDRFGWIEDFSKPQFFPERLKALHTKKPKSIFMNSMSDIAYWSPEQIETVLDAIRKQKQHNYIFLTKNNALPYNFFYDKTFTESSNLFFGRTMTEGVIGETTKCNFDFLNIEPMHGVVWFQRHGVSARLKQIIIGAETGNRKGGIRPTKYWIEGITAECDERGIAVFMKESLRAIMGADFRQDPLIWAVKDGAA